MTPRQQGILELLRNHGEVSVQDLSDHFEVAHMTIRRDLAALEGGGDLLRTHGGAILSRAAVIEFAFVEKGRQNAEAKRAIAAEVATMVRPGMSVTLDTGTTTLEVARAIAPVKDLRVLTSSLAIASTLYAHENIELILLGGTARKGSPDLSGWITEENVKRFRVDLAVLGADGVCTDGAFTTDVNIARVSQAIISGAKQVVMAVDHSKFDTAAFVKLADWSTIDSVVTDSKLAPKPRRWLMQSVKDVRFARVARLSEVH
jgi:DeoR/GlpR family transcriptional regulator of sugar metabolism